MSSMLIAERYARALAASTDDSRELEETHKSLHAFAEAYEDLHDLQNLLKNPAISPLARSAVFDDVLAKLLADDRSRVFVRTLYTRGRIALIADVVHALGHLVDERLGRVHAQVSSAAELSAEAIDKVSSGLEKHSGKRVRVETKVDADLLGGVVVQIGSAVIDGSLRSRLARIREALLAEESN